MPKIFGSDMSLRVVLGFDTWRQGATIQPPAPRSIAWHRGDTISRQQDEPVEENQPLKEEIASGFRR